MSSNSVRVCHVCSGHRVDDSRVFHRECSSLAAAGYDVHLIASGDGENPYELNDVTVHPLPRVRNRRERLSRRKTVAQIAASLNPDLFHVHEPELLAPVLSLAAGRPVVWDVHESYLDVLMDRHWIPRLLRPILRQAWDLRERQLIPRCGAVVAVTPHVAKRYEHLHKRVEIIANYPELEIGDCATIRNSHSPRCVFAGSIAPNRGVSQVFRALSELRGRGLAVAFDLAGPGQSQEYVSSLLDEAAALGIQDLVNYHGVLSRRDTIQLARTATIGVVPHLPYGNNLAAWPIKMLEFMSLGLPVAYSNLPNHAELIGDCGAGIAFDPCRPSAIADAIESLVQQPELARQMGERGRCAVRERFNWTIEKAKLLSLYRDLLP